MAKVSAADRLAKIPSRTGNGVKTWYQRIDAETLKELEEIRTRFRENKYTHSKAEIFRFCATELNLPCKYQAFVRWLPGESDGADVECELAYGLDIPVFHSIEELHAAFTEQL